MSRSETTSASERKTMVGDAASDQTPGAAHRPETAPTPPLVDLTGRPEPAPGPLTKPSPVVRPPKKRPRWLVPVIIVALLAVAAITFIAWQASQSGLA